MLTSSFSLGATSHERAKNLTSRAITTLWSSIIITHFTNLGIISHSIDRIIHRLSHFKINLKDFLWQPHYFLLNNWLTIGSLPKKWDTSATFVSTILTVFPEECYWFNVRVLHVPVFGCVTAGESEPKWISITANAQLPELLRGASQNQRRFHHYYRCG